MNLLQMFQIKIQDFRIALRPRKFTHHLQCQQDHQEEHEEFEELLDSMWFTLLAAGFTHPKWIDYSWLFYNLLNLPPKNSINMRQLLPVPKIIWTQGFYQGFLEEITRDIWNFPPFFDHPAPTCADLRLVAKGRCGRSDGLFLFHKNWEMFDLSFPIVFTRSMILEVGKFRRIWLSFQNFVVVSLKHSLSFGAPRKKSKDFRASP